jgi:hypothetical protein
MCITPTFQAVSQRLPSEGPESWSTKWIGPKLVRQRTKRWAGYSEGLTVIERGSIEPIIEEQQFSLMHGSEASILRAGHLLGAMEAVLIWSKPE